MTTCPACGHEERADPSWRPGVWLRQKLNMNVPPPPCPHTPPDTTGWGEPPCGCRHPFHSLGT